MRKAPYCRGMRLLVVAPCFYPLGQSGYSGIERLAVLLAREFARAKHKVEVIGASRSTGIEGCMVWRSSAEGSFVEAEEQAWKEYGWMASDFDFTIDLSHSHFFRRHGESGASWIWHDPKLMTPPVPLTGLYALSQWQATRHLEATHQTIPVLDCICADPEVYYYDSKVEVSDRWFSLGILDKNKGQREAALLAEEAGIKLDIAGKPVDDDVVREIREIEKRTQGRVRYLGELKLGEVGKAKLLRQARGMLYWPSYPEGFGEAHSQKLVEALMLGLPCIVRDQGAMAEVFGDMALVVPEWNTPFAWISDQIAERAAKSWSAPIVAQRILEVVAGVKA